MRLEKFYNNIAALYYGGKTHDDNNLYACLTRVHQEMYSKEIDSDLPKFWEVVDFMKYKYGIEF